MSLNELRDRAFKIAEDHGFHENWDFARALMLTVSELAEALEADRNKRWGYLINGEPVSQVYTPENVDYAECVKGTVQEEIADAIIRICDLAGVYGIDLDWHIKAKIIYNEKRPYKHGKKY